MRKCHNKNEEGAILGNISGRGLAGTGTHGTRERKARCRCWPCLCRSPSGTHGGAFCVLVKEGREWEREGVGAGWSRKEREWEWGW